MASNVISLNNGLEMRTSKSGKSRFTVRIDAEPIFVVTDPKTLGAPIAAAIALHLRERVLGITATVSAATMRTRRTATKAFAKGEPWAMKMFSGGRTGITPPTTSDRMFNFSGRFAQTITANASKDGAWRINVAANRLTGAAKDVRQIWTKLVELVPEFQNIGMILESNDLLRGRIKQKLQQHLSNVISKGKKTSKPATAWDLAKALAKTAKAAADLVAA